VVLALGVAVVEGGQLGSRDVEAHGPQLLGEPRVRTGGGGLTLQRTDLALDLADQVEQALEVLVGAGQSALGPFTAAAELEDARRLLDDRATVLGPGLQDGVEMPLADDHVLLAPDARVGEQLLDVQ